MCDDYSEDSYSVGYDAGYSTGYDHGVEAGKDSKEWEIEDLLAEIAGLHRTIADLERGA
jgi:hypothetical protein